MKIPSIHLNGSGAESLMEGYLLASKAVECAIDTLCQTAPHGRDYYPQGTEAWHEAHREHNARLGKLQVVKAELDELLLSIQDQIDDQNARRALRK